MQNYCLKYAKQVEITTNKQKITYLSIFANFFLLFFLYYFIFLLLSLYRSFSRTPSLFCAGQKTISRDKNDITGQKTISRDISFLCHRVIALIKAQVCDKQLYQHEWKLEKRENAHNFEFFQFSRVLI